MDLSKYNQAYQEAKAPETTFDNLPEGKYTAQLTVIRFEENKNTQKPQLTLTFKITGPKYAGRLQFVNRPFNNAQDTATPDEQAKRAAQCMGIIKKDLRTLGIDDNDLQVVQSKFKDVVDCHVEIQIKNSEKLNKNGVPYQNTYLNKKLDTPPATPSASNNNIANTFGSDVSTANLPF